MEQNRSGWGGVLARCAVAVVAAAALMGPACAAGADAVEVQGAWTRTTVTGQSAAGVYLRLTAATASRLVEVHTPVAGMAAVHEMRMDNGAVAFASNHAGVMRMRELSDGLELPAGKTVELAPGGYHIMLMNLKAPLARDSRIPLTLVFQDAKGVKSTLSLQVPVLAMSATGPAPAMAPMDSMGPMGDHTDAEHTH